MWLLEATQLCYGVSRWLLGIVVLLTIHFFLFLLYLELALVHTPVRQALTFNVVVLSQFLSLLPFSSLDLRKSSLRDRFLLFFHFSFHQLRWLMDYICWAFLFQPKQLICLYIMAFTGTNPLQITIW